MANRSAKPDARIVDAHFHDGGGCAFQLAAALDLAQGGDHRVRVLGQFDRSCVGEEFARAREREADHRGQGPGKRDQHGCDDERGATAALAATAAVAVIRAPVAPAEPAVEPHPEQELGEKGDHAGDDHRDHHHADVAVADMGQLVAEHRFDLGVVEPGEQPGRHGDRVLLLVHPGGEGVERVALHHLQLRHRNAARDAQVFQQIVEARLLLAGHLAPAGDGVDDALVKIIGDDDPHGRADRRPRRGAEKITPSPLQQPLQRGVVRQRLARERAGIDEQIDEQEQARQQRDRAALVGLDMRVEPVSGHGDAS